MEDVNDNSPRFMVDSYDFHLNEAAAVGTPVGQVIAVDEDEGLNGRLRYSIPSGHGASLFSIDDVGVFLFMISSAVILTPPMLRLLSSIVQRRKYF